jgi:hypothetical protein
VSAGDQARLRKLVALVLTPHQSIRTFDTNNHILQAVQIQIG